MKLDTVKELFFKGEYNQIIEDHWVLPTHFVYIVGSLCFLGRAKEADLLFHKFKHAASSTELAYSHFFLSIGWIRKAKYGLAKKYLMANFTNSQTLKIKAMTTPDEQIQIFLNQQGLAFYFYFLGRFKKSLAWNFKSINTANSLDDHWMKALSYDLYANNLVQNGKIYEGLNYFELASESAKKIKSQSLLSVFKGSHLVTRCEYGIDISQSFKELDSAIQRDLTARKPLDISLAIEYSRQLTLQGRWIAAQKILNIITPLVYQSENRRQEARINLRWAELYFLKAEPVNCLHYLRAGLKSLKFVDQTFAMQFLGLEIKVYKKLLNQKSPQATYDRLISLSQKFNYVKNNQILIREGLLKKNNEYFSDDNINKYILRAKKSPDEAQKVIIETQYFAWIYEFLNIEKNTHHVILNLEPKSITIVSSVGIDHFSKELSDLNYKLLILLAQGFTSKETLLKKIWGYEYDPLRHDSLIYSALSKIRKLFSQNLSMIETTEIGYQLNAQVTDMQKIIKTKTKVITTETRTDQINQGSDDISKYDFIADNIDVLQNLNINVRQLQIIKYLENNSFISVKKIVELFNTTEITAHRDINSLFIKKIVLRLGQGRSTQYHLKDKGIIK